MLRVEATRESTTVTNVGHWLPSFSPTELEFRNLTSKLTRTVRKILTEHDDVEDVIQQTFLKALTNLSQISGDASLETWLTRIAITEALLHLRTVRRMKLVQYGEQNTSVAGVTMNWLPSFMPDPEENLFQKEMSHLLDKALASLSPMCREVVLTYYAGGLSGPEIASRLGVAAGTAKSRPFRARHILRHMLGKSTWSRRADGQTFMASLCLVSERHLATSAPNRRVVKHPPGKMERNEQKPRPDAFV